MQFSSERFRMTCVVLFVAGLFLPSLDAHAQTNIIRVGHPLDLACDYDDIHGAMIAAAMDGSSTTEIRLAMTLSYFDTATNISDQSVDLIGGYSDCSDDEPGTAQTILYANSGSNWPVMLVENGTSTRHQVLLKNLVLREASSVTDGGGAKLVGNVIVVFDNVDLTDNSASRGGGVFIDGDGEDIDVTFTNNSQVSFNTATDGGVHIGFEAELNMRATGGCQSDSACSRITNNAAVTSTVTGRGGGLFVASGAEAWVYRTEISGNSASRGSAIRVTGVGVNPTIPASSTRQRTTTVSARAPWRSIAVM